MMEDARIQETEKVIQTRPRVKMQQSIAIVVDDVDPKTRKVIMDSMYTSNWRKLCEETGFRCTKNNLNKSAAECAWTRNVRIIQN